MDRQQIRGELVKIFGIVSEKLAKRTDITEDTLLRQGLGLDSLQILEMHFEIQARLSVTVEEDEAKGLKTVGDLVNLIEARLRGGTGTAPCPADRQGPAASPGS